MRSVIFCLLFMLISCKVPPNFKTCNRKDPNFKKCYLEAAQHGIRQLTKPYKELGLPNIEPLYVPVLTVKGGGGAVAVDQNFKDCDLGGLTAIAFDRFELDLEKNTLDAMCTVPALTFACHYNLDGRVLFLPMQGDGNSTVIMKNLYIIFHAQYKRVIKGNKTYFSTVSTKINGTLSNIHFQFDNLFNGNKQLGDNINQVLNDNWEQIYEEIKPQYLEIVRQVLEGITDRIWSKVSLEEYFDN